MIKIIVSDIGKYNANTIIHLQIKLEVRGQFRCNEAKTWGMALCWLQGPFFRFSFRHVENLPVQRD